jgi:hypothetical protein
MGPNGKNGSTDAHYPLEAVLVEEPFLEPQSNGIKEDGSLDEMYEPPEFTVQDELLLLVQHLQEAELIATSLGLRDVVSGKAVVMIARVKNHILRRYAYINEKCVLNPILAQFSDPQPPKEP